MYQPYFDALISAIGHKFAIETDATWQQISRSVTTIHYQTPLTHPWPRTFEYQLEFFTLENDVAQLTAAVEQVLKPEPQEHVLNLLAPNLTSAVEATLAETGYHLAWSNILMVASLNDDANTINKQTNVTIRPATSNDITTINDLEPDHLSTTAGLENPHLHQFVAEQEGTILGKGQLVTTSNSIAYVSDMFVSPTTRRLGIGGQLMRTLHQAARASGAKEVLLIPSQMTRQIGFYEKYGYRPLLPIHLFIPADSLP